MKKHILEKKVLNTSEFYLLWRREMKKNFYCDIVAGTPVGFLNTNPDLKKTRLS